MNNTCEKCNTEKASYILYEDNRSGEVKCSNGHVIVKGK